MLKNIAKSASAPSGTALRNASVSPSEPLGQLGGVVGVQRHREHAVGLGGLELDAATSSRDQLVEHLLGGGGVGVEERPDPQVGRVLEVRDVVETLAVDGDREAVAEQRRDVLRQRRARSASRTA